MEQREEGSGAARWTLFRKSFWIPFVIGVALVLVAVGVETKWAPTHPALQTGLKTLETLGLAAAIAAIYSLVTSTHDFLEYVRARLAEIVLGREFLGRIGPKARREAAKALLVPSSGAGSRCASLDAYYEECIDKALAISTRDVRSGYQMEETVHFDAAQGRVISECVTSYRLYPSATGYSPVEVRFDSPHHKWTSFSVWDPQGSKLNVTLPDEPDKTGDPASPYVFSAGLQEVAGDLQYVDVMLGTREVGHDHWILCAFKFLMPVDRFNYTLRSMGDLTVREGYVFGAGEAFELDPESATCRRLHCNRWLEAGAGFAFVVSRAQDQAVPVPGEPPDTPSASPPQTGSGTA